jgi:DNA polymerase-3 subunit gamma/tau
VTAYLVLARKWRPAFFSEVVGQDHVTVTLRKAFEKDRLAHAYLFSGPRGCGKTTTARLLAKVINCEVPKDGEPCNTCASCLAVNAGTHLDMIEIDGASNRGIDEIRDLREKIGYAPSQSRSKIYIIDEVHMLTPQAFNALLKTLEEPPQHVYLVFATTEPHKVPATILSRCQRFNFKRLELSELQGQLERICTAEKIEHDEDAILMICRRADGSMRDAESLLDQCIAASDGRIDIPTVRRVLGLVDTHVVAGLLDAVSRRDRRAALEIVDGVVSAGLDLEEFFIAFLEGIRDLAVISISGGEADWLDLTSEETATLSEIAGRFTVEDLLFLFRSMSRALREFRAASRPRYHLEAAVAEAASWESAVEVSELLRLIGQEGTTGAGTPGAGTPGAGTPGDGGGSTAGGGPAPVSGGSADSRRTGRGSGASASGKETAEQRRAKAASSAERRAARTETGTTAASAGDTAASAGATIPGEQTSPGDGCAGGQKKAYPDSPVLERLGGREQWERFLAQVRESKLTLGIWLMAGEPSAIEGERLILSFTSQSRFAHEMIRDERNKRLIETHLERFYGRKFVVETCEAVSIPASGPAEGPEKEAFEAARRSSRPAAAQVPEDAPVLRELIEELGGEIEPPGGTT